MVVQVGTSTDKHGIITVVKFAFEHPLYRKRTADRHGHQNNPQIIN